MSGLGTGDAALAIERRLRVRIAIMSLLCSSSTLGSFFVPKWTFGMIFLPWILSAIDGGAARIQAPPLP
jgi:hypothetical protein